MPAAIEQCWIYRSAAPLISLRSKWRLTGFSRRFTPKNPVRLHNPFGELPRWGAKNVLPLNLIALRSPRSLSFAVRQSMSGNPKRKPAIKKSSGIALFILHGASVSLCAVPPFRISNFSCKRDFLTESKGSTLHGLTLNLEPLNHSALIYAIIGPHSIL